MTTRVEKHGNELRLTRIFDAPRQTVFEAWTDPKKVSQWWGCAQTTSVETTIDLRVGGEFRHVMQIADCGQVDSVSTFTEVDPPRKLAYITKGGSVEGMDPMPDTTTIAEFHEVNDSKTELRLTIIGLPAGPFQNIISSGWQAAVDKLARLINDTDPIRASI